MTSWNTCKGELFLKKSYFPQQVIQLEKQVTSSSILGRKDLSEHPHRVKVSLQDYLLIEQNVYSCHSCSPSPNKWKNLETDREKQCGKACQAAFTLVNQSWGFVLQGRHEDEKDNLWIINAELIFLYYYQKKEERGFLFIFHNWILTKSVCLHW